MGKRRTAAENLSNISLDGNIIQSKVKPNLENETQRIDEDSQKSRDAVVPEQSESSQDTKSRRHKVVHSVSVTGDCQYSEEKSIGDIYKERNSKNTTPTTVHFPIRRSVSLSDSTSSDSSSATHSTRWQTSILKHRVSFLTSPVFHSKRRDNDKR